MIREWNDLRVFLAVARKGGYAAAAASLGMAAATARRRVDVLETAWREPLLTSEAGTLTPTATGLKLVGLAADLERTVAGFLAAADRERREAAGVVRLASSEVFAQHLLPPVLVGLRAAHPGISIDLIGLSGPAAFDPAKADVGLVGRPPSAGAGVAQDLGGFEVGLYGRKDLLDRIGRPRSASELRSAPLAGAPDDALTWRLYGPMGFAEGDLMFRAHAGNFAALLGIVRAGAAIGQCPVALARHFPELERVLPDQGYVHPLWLAMDPDQGDVRRVQIVHHALGEAVRAFLAAGRAGP